MHAPTSFLRDRRGATLAEFLMLVGLIALVALAGFRAFGTAITGKAETQAACVETFSCGPGNPQGADGEAMALGTPPGTPGGENPDGGGDGDDGGGGFLGGVGDFFSGAWDVTKSVGKGFFVDGVWGTVTGVWTIVTNPVDTAKGLWTAVTNPVDTWNAIKDGVVTAWNEDPARLIGAGLFEVVTLPVAALKATKATKLATATKVVENIDDASDVAKTVDKVDDATDASKAADEAAAAAARKAKDAPKGAPNAAPAADIGKGGRLTMDEVLNQIPEGTPNTWNPNAPAGGGYTGPGFRYEWTGADGTKYKVWGHGANPNAPPGSNAANGPTVRVQINNRFATTKGETVRNVDGKSPVGEANANDSHIPLDGWTPP
jgi:Flp pilus assembly pilin Flp